MSTTNYTTGDDSDESGWAGQGLLRRGWSLGKKVAVAGVALSVAPVVIPPLLVFSAFGLALSVPFGVYYVGVVGTERLMQSLLPLDRGQEEKGYLDEREFGHEENWDEEGEDYEISVQGEGYVGMSGSKSEEMDEKRENGDTIEEEDQGETDAATKEYGVAGYLKNETDEMVEKDLMPEKDGTIEDDAVEENRGMKRDDIEGETENDNVTVDRIINVTSATVDRNSVTVMEIEITPDDEAELTAVAEQGTELAGAEVIQAEAGNTEVVDDKGIVTADTDSRVAKKEENDTSAVDSEGADALEAEDFNAVASASSESSVTSDVEEFYTKKELWEQLRALRTIVGYRAAIAKTLPGELRALYTFTGVEFPSTATDASNLLDLNYKLQFLKSIIGIK